MSFENIIGNDSVKKLLSHSIDSNNILHSYMFIGPDGIGKSLFAKEFAKMILNNPIDIYNHPDFMIIEPEDGKSLKIEQIRYLQEKISEKPIGGSKKIYIITDSDSMTKEAQNCLLKTLEEPPFYAIIVLIVSNENKMLTTIKSRCTKVSFYPLSVDELKSYFTLNSLPIPNNNIFKVCSRKYWKSTYFADASC